MNYVTHMLHPSQDGSKYLRMRCGLIRHETKDTFQVTDKKDEVTCSKCLDFIENPVRTLRQYGHLQIGRFHLSLFPHPFHDVFSSAQEVSPGTWSVLIYNESNINQSNIKAQDKKEVVTFILSQIENEFLSHDLKIHESSRTAAGVVPGAGR